MFENYKQMSADEKAQVKAIHRAIRANTGGREGNLAWAFVRGFPYRRVERQTRQQVMPDGTVVNHNPPNARYITTILGTHIPGFAEVAKSSWATKPSPEVEQWLANPEGAIAAPVREKKPYVRTEVA
jgi:hypothetical protein